MPVFFPYKVGFLCIFRVNFRSVNRSSCHNDNLSQQLYYTGTYLPHICLLTAIYLLRRQPWQINF